MSTQTQLSFPFVLALCHGATTPAPSHLQPCCCTRYLTPWSCLPPRVCSRAVVHDAANGHGAGRAHTRHVRGPEANRPRQDTSGAAGRVPGGAARHRAAAAGALRCCSARTRRGRAPAAAAMPRCVHKARAYRCSWLHMAPLGTPIGQKAAWATRALVRKQLCVAALEPALEA